MSNRRAVILSTLCGAAFLGTSALSASIAAPYAQEAQTQPEVQPEQEKASPHLFAGSLWHKAKNDIVGTYRIFDEDGKRYVELGSDFKTKKGPDLKLVLSPQTASRVKDKTALDGGHVVSLLKSERGRQRYEIPTSMDLSKYRSLLIHCEKYTKLWGSVDLTQGRMAAHGSAWSKKANKVTGAFEIIEHEGRLTLRVSDKFSTKSGPDLKWVLSTHSTREASGSNALRGGIKLGSLRSNKGAQTVRLPEGTDISKYRTLLVHCEKYSKLWAAADLKVVRE